AELDICRERPADRRYYRPTEATAAPWLLPHSACPRQSGSARHPSAAHGLQDAAQNLHRRPRPLPVAAWAGICGRPGLSGRVPPAQWEYSLRLHHLRRLPVLASAAPARSPDEPAPALCFPLASLWLGLQGPSSRRLQLSFLPASSRQAFSTRS